MFADACDKARQFTRPVVINQYLNNGECVSGVASFIVLNDEGWILSAWHIQQQLEQLSASVQQIQAYDQQVEVIKQAAMSPKDRQNRLRRLTPVPPKACRAFSAWWSWDGVHVVDAQGIALPHADILVGRLEPFDASWIKGYPVLKDPAKPQRQGTSLCRLGFPFPAVKATYDPSTRNFSFGPGSLQLPLFPIEGILTRSIHSSPPGGSVVTGFLETSSPGLMGQSGGPIVDIHGTVWAIQSNTQHLSLGFNPVVPDSKNGEKEHQFLNVGWGTDPATIVYLLRQRGVAHTLSPY